MAISSQYLQISQAKKEKVMRYQFKSYKHSGTRKNANDGTFLYPVTIEIFDSTDNILFTDTIDIPVHGSVTNADTDQAIMATIMTMIRNKYQ